MEARTPMVAGFLMMAIALAGGCESGPTALEQLAPSFPAALVVPTGAENMVTVCKDGPANTYSFDVTTQQDWINFPNGNSFTLQKDECKTVAEASRPTDYSGRFVTLVEQTPPAGTRFLKVELWNYGAMSGGGQELKATLYTNAPMTVGPFGGDNGWIVVYYNISTPCTLTQGYWKTHNESFAGGASKNADPTWTLLGGAAEGTTFYQSGQSWFGVFNTPPAGNAYYILAHQFMAARLNVLAGADPTAVSGELAAATTLFGTYTPAQIAAMKSTDSVVKRFKSLADTLDNYNKGLIGPGHCEGPVD